MKERVSFVLRISYASVFDDMSDENAGKLIKAIFRYISTGKDFTELKEPELKMASKFIKNDLDHDYEKYKKRCEQNAENGKKGGKNKGKNSERYRTQTKIANANENSERKPIDCDCEGDYDGDYDGDCFFSEKEIHKEKKLKFEKPSLEQIRDYCVERKNNINPQHFFDYYESVGWKVGKNAMKDWRACVRTWENKQKQNGGKQNGHDYNKDTEPNKYAGLGRRIEVGS